MGKCANGANIAMAEEDLDKQHNATPFKLAEARKKGQVARSMEVPAFFGLLGALLTLVAILGTASVSVARGTSWWIGHADRLAQDSAFMWYSLGRYFQSLTEIVFSIILVGALCAIIAGVVHVGPVLSFTAMKPDFSKLNPAKGFKKVFSRKSIVDAIRLLLKVAAFAGVAYLLLKYNANYYLTSNHATTAHFLSAFVKILTEVIFALLGVFLVFAVFDLWFSKREFARQMRMSTRDIKEETKRHEGNPEIKSKRKKILAELLKKATSTKNVKDADVIITNPGHVAIALKYRANTMSAPIVVCKGRGFIAANIRRLARKHGIPIIRKPGLARGILQKVDIGETIYSEFQQPVATIYRWVIDQPENRVFS